MAKKKKDARKFIIVGVLPGKISFKGREIDLSTITTDQAAELIEQKCDFVQWEAEAQAEENPQ